MQVISHFPVMESLIMKFSQREKLQLHSKRWKNMKHYKTFVFKADGGNFLLDFCYLQNRDENRLLYIFARFDCYDNL